MRKGTRALLLALLSSTAVLLALPLGSQDGGEPARAPKAEAKKKAGGGSVVLWDGIELTPNQAIKRMYRLKKANKWGPDRLPRLCELCLATGDKRLKPYATWYQALIAGHEGRDDEAAAKLKEAVDLGYRNVLEMEMAEELEGARAKPEVKALIERLQVDLKGRMETNFRSGIDAGFAEAGTALAPPWKPDLKALDGSSFFQDAPVMVVVVTRIHHDGFESHVPNLKKLGEKFPVGLVFYQLDPTDSDRLRQTSDYAKGLERLDLGPVPCAVAGRPEYKELQASVEKHFRAAAARKVRGEEDDEEVFRDALPFTVFFGRGAVPLHSTLGVLADWEVDYLIEALAKVAAAAAPPPKPVEEPAPVKPEEPKPEPAAAPPKPEAPKPEPGKVEEPKAEPKPEPKPESESKPGEPKPKNESPPPPPKEETPGGDTPAPKSEGPLRQ